MIFDRGEKSNKGMRSLRYAFAASVLAHLLLLWPRASVMDAQDAPAALQATILEPPPQIVPVAPAPALPTPPTRPAERAVSPAPTFTEPLAKPEPSLPSVAVAPATVTVPDVPANPGRPVPSKTTISAGAAATASKAPAPVLSPDGLSRYRLALAAQARRFKRYPTQAKALGWVGTSDIRIEVGSDSSVRAVTLARSSGHDALDQAALAMVDAGARRTRLPDSLRGREFSVNLPVVFNLEDE